MNGLFIAYPCYQGQCYVESMTSIMHLVNLCKGQGIHVEFFPLTHESLIPRARNVCACAFLRSTCSHMLFVDADIIFNPMDALNLMNAGHDLVCGLYPKKTLHIDEIKKHAQDAHSIKNLTELCAEYSSNQVLTDPCVDSNYLEITDAATGFMMCSRVVFEEMMDIPDLKYRNDCSMYRQYELDGYMYNFFVVGIHNERLLSEDYGFSLNWRSIGHKIYADKRIQLTHIGRFNFYGRPQI